MFMVKYLDGTSNFVLFYWGGLPVLKPLAIFWTRSTWRLKKQLYLNAEKFETKAREAIVGVGKGQNSCNWVVN